VVWLDRLAKAVKENVALDDNTFKTGNFDRFGGKRKLLQVFDNDLDALLGKLSDYVWDEPA